jgi:KUP system potassium uptake protein
VLVAPGRQDAAMPGARHDVSGRRLAGLSLAALGVVFGDIGTSPLYAMRESFEGAGHDLAVTEANVLGILSLVFWSLVIVISIKYLAFVMRADNQGEGGILALTSLVKPSSGTNRGRRTLLILFGLFGTALLYGDGVITPAISVLAAVEGTETATDALSAWVLPIAIVILVALFALQSRGTASVGRLFGPVMVLWFSVLALLGGSHLADDLHVMAAVNPIWAVRFFEHNQLTGFLALGSVFLVVTGGEALYADMGHFGPRPIRFGWFTLVLPALLLNYFGQGALLLSDPEAIDHPFYELAPSWGVLPLVVLSTMATVIASQALISGAFSVTMQAVQLGYTPRVRIEHTSKTEIGQIYVPALNWSLMVACVGLVLGFRSSSNLAAAYGVAVTTTMVITTLLFFVVLREHFGWQRRTAIALTVPLLVIDLGFFGANLFKIPAGGWFPIIAGALVFTVMTTWRTGRSIVADRIRHGEVPLEVFLASLFSSEEPPVRAPGTAAYLFSMPGLTPPALMANIRHNHTLHEQTLIVSIVTDDTPRVLPARRTDLESLGHGVHAVVLHYGYMEQPNIPTGLTQGTVNRLGISPVEVTYFLGAEALVVTDRPGMARWREHLFALLSRNATPASSYFGLPPTSTATLGIQVEL